MIGLLDEFDAISEHAEKILSNADNMITNEQIESLKKLITQNQQLLYQIGVSHPSIDQITKLSIKLGFACKLTGAGGGGCAIILLDPSDPGKRTELESELLKMGYKGWEAKLGGPGVKVLSYDDVQL